VLWEIRGSGNEASSRSSLSYGSVRTGDKPWNANSGRYCIVWRGNVIRRRGGNSTPFFDYEIVGVFLWAALSDRPVSWACKAENWPIELKPARLPSQPTMSRRLGTTETSRLLAAMETRLDASQHVGLRLLVDGKPLVIGAYSKDVDAAWGRITRSYAKGYKIHAIYDAGPIPKAWDVEPLNVAEPHVAARLIPRLRRGGGYIVGDKSYDSNPLHATATACGYQLVAEQKRPGKGLGHRSHTRGRLRSMELLQTDFGRDLHRSRGDVERQFAWLTNHSGGLPPLPAWVRRIYRVRLWVKAKLIIHALYALAFHPPSPQAAA
jgi:hypothetical protein